MTTIHDSSKVNTRNKKNYGLEKIFFNKSSKNKLETYLKIVYEGNIANKIRKYMTEQNSSEALVKN